MPPVLVIDHHNGVPAYRQLMDQIKFQIAAGVLKPGEEMESTRALSASLSLNPMTISKAYGLLEREGVLERRRGQTLTVRAAEGGQAAAARAEVLRKALEAAATTARQLGVSDGEALRLFKETLNAHQHEHD